MKMPTQTDAFKSTLSDAAKAVGLVGAELQTFLSRELLSKVVLRKGRDVVLLTGPTGAGKEMVSALAHKISELSLQRTGRLVELNCANLGANMFESQLFGYKRGAFTGADRDFEGFACQAKGVPLYSTSSSRYRSKIRRNCYVFLESVSTDRWALLARRSVMQ